MSTRACAALVLCSLIILHVKMPEGFKSNLQMYSVKLSPSDLGAGVSITRYPGFGSSRVKCLSLIMTSRFSNSVVCITDSGDCLVTNASFPPFYDKDNVKPLHTCFTSLRLLINKEAALASCRISVGCCPAPFTTVSNVGCIYTSLWYSPTYTFSAARKACQSFWPSGDLLVKPGSWAKFFSYLSDAGVDDPWIGATKDAVSSTWKWIDGTAVAGSEWGVNSLLVAGSQPDGVGVPRDGLPTNCGHVMSGADLLGTRKLGDDACEHSRPYVCQIK